MTMVAVAMMIDSGNDDGGGDSGGDSGDDRQW